MRDPVIRKTRMFLVQEQFRNQRTSEVTTRHQLDGIQEMFAKILKGMMDKGLVNADRKGGQAAAVRDRCLRMHREASAAFL